MTGSNWIVTKDMFLTQNEIQKLYYTLNDAKDLALHRKKYLVHVRDYFILRTFLETGLRVFELAALKIGDFKNDSLIVQCGKGSKKRNIHLLKSTQKLLREYLRIKQEILLEPTDDEAFLFLSERRTSYTTVGLRKRVKFWFSKCGFSQKFSCHTCRHSYISHMLANGVDVSLVRDNAGHSSLATTSIYSHVVNSSLGDLELYPNSFASKGKRN